MGQKIRPSGLRLGIIRDWESRWYADREYRDFLLEDIKIRQFLATQLRGAGLSGIQIERRVGDGIRVTLNASKPGIIIGRGGAGAEQLRKDLERVTASKVHVNIQEIKNPDLNAELVADRVARGIERRETFRRAMKQAVISTMKAGARGVKIIVSGRLGGAEIARSESMKEGKIPLHTIRADIDYGVTAARTKYGPIGVKVWIYKGDVLPGQMVEREPSAARPRRGRARARMAPGGPAVTVEAGPDDRPSRGRRRASGGAPDADA